MMHLPKPSKIIHKALLAWLLFGLAATLKAQNRSLPTNELINFEVLSVRILSESEEIARSPDVIGANVAVRVRLSTIGSKGVYYLTWADSMIPLGYRVKKTDKGTAWGLGTPGKESLTSPGYKKLASGLETNWLILPPYSSIEWELLDSTAYGGEQHAFTLFMKQQENGNSMEAVSHFFVVPANK